MTKKMLFGLMSASMLFATSCNNETELVNQAGESAMVSFQIATPEMATRAYSDGTTATQLQYAVYDANGTILTTYTATEENGKAEEIYLSTTVNFQLTTDNQYSVVFWASEENAPYSFNPEDKTITVDYDDVTSNNETYDAFYAYHTFTVSEKVQVEDIQLKRPFAQLNIGASDYQASADAHYTPSQSYVKVKNVYNTLNFADGTVVNPTEVEFDFADIKRDETFPVVGYEYVAMNYLLVAKDKELVDIEFKYTDDATSTDAAHTKTRQIGSVPVQRNYRTNIYGDLLTSSVDVNITIDPIYEGEENKKTNDILYAFEKGGEVTLTEDTDVLHTLYVRAGVNAILNLNGKTLKNHAGEGNPTDVIVVEEGATLTINGEGTIEAVSGFDGYAVIAEGTVIINGGTFKSGIDANGEPNAVIYARGNGKVYVNGGTFPNDNNTKFVLNKKDADRATTTIEVSGGLFQNFDPANNAAENAGTNFLAENCISLEKADNWFEVVSGAIVENADEFKAAYSNENLQYIYVAADLDFGTSFVSGVAGDKVILGNGYKFNAGGKTTKNYALGISNAVNVSINDLVMNGGGGIYVSNGANVEVNNVTLKTKYSASSRHMFYVNNAELTVNSGNFEVGRTSCKYFTMQNNAKAYVTGGTWEDMMAKESPVSLDNGTSLEISGGKFQVGTANYKFDPTAYLAAGYKAERVGDYMVVSAE